MFRTLFTVALIAIPVFAIQQPVKTKGGQVSGMPGRDAAITSFKGIPFAAPPVGDLRWHAPVPAKPWTGLLKAEKFSNSCIQNIVTENKPWTYEFMTHNEIGEDCLYLNVWTGAKAATEKRPVFVYVYGGAFTGGSAQVPFYDGEGLASKGLVVVTFNYRIGVFGFLAHPELSKESGHNASGNWGIMDQVAALQWVHDNIAAFGGDPARVTVAGQSAGAQSVLALTATPLAKGLFARAIAESGASITGMALTSTTTLADNEQAGVKFVQSKGAEDLKALRAMSVQQILAPAAGGGRGGVRSGVITDGYVLPATIGQIFADGKQNDVPTLTGWNADENGASPKPNVTLETYKKNAQQRYGDQAESFLKLYPAASDADAVQMSNAAARDQWRVNAYLWAASRAKTAKTNAYLYYWNHVLPGPDAGIYGAFHSSEFPYTLNTLYMSERPFTDMDRQIADQMSSYWVNFTTNGDPNGKGLPVWQSVNQRPQTTMQLGDNPGMIPITNDTSKTAFWTMFYAKQMAR